jgi:LPS export ABC transporter permease LptG/LPS export ABC transporter permease LptF
MFRIIDRYLVREAIGPTLLALLIFTFILEIPVIIRDMEPLIATGLPWRTAGWILLTLVPQGLALTIPMALLVGLLVALGRFSADRESVALQACGISLYRLVRPVGLLSVVALAATSYVMLVAVPKANDSYRRIVHAIVANTAQTQVHPRVFFERFPNMVLYVRDLQPGGTGWRDLFLADTRNPQEPQLITAQAGRLVIDRTTRRVDLALEHGAAHRFDGEAYIVDAFQTRTVGLDPETMFPRTGFAKDESSMTIGELRHVEAGLAKEGLSTHNPVMAIHRKFSIPVACLVFALLALGLGITDRKDAKQNSFVIGLAVFFAYYILMYLGQSLAKGHQIPAWLAMWLPNIVLGAAGVALLVHRARGREIGGDFQFTLPSRIADVWRRRATGIAMASSPAGHGAPAPPPGHQARPVLVVRVPRQFVPRLGLLDRYLASRYARVFGLTIAAMLGLFYIGEFIDLSEKLFKGNATGGMLLRYFVLSTPQKLYYVTALASLVAAIATIGVMTRTSELVAMRACGISLYRTALPLVAFSVVWGGLLFGLEETVLPGANRDAKKIYDQIRDRAPRTVNVLNRQWLAGTGNRLYHYNYYEPQSRRFGDLTIYDFDQSRHALAQRTYTAYAQFGRGAWHAGAGWVRHFKEGRVTRFDRFDRRALAIESPDYFTTEELNGEAAERLGYRDLRKHIGELQTAGFSVTPLAVRLYRKLSFPFVTVIMTLIAVPFAVTTGRRGALYGIGAAIALAIAYWTLQSAFAAIGSAGMLPAVLAAWAPNILFAAAAMYLLFTVRT